MGSRLNHPLVADHVLGHHLRAPAGCSSSSRSAGVRVSTWIQRSPISSAERCPQNTRARRDDRVARVRRPSCRRCSASRASCPSAARTASRSDRRAASGSPSPGCRISGLRRAVGQRGRRRAPRARGSARAAARPAPRRRPAARTSRSIVYCVVAGRDVDALAAEPQHRRRPLGRIVAEEQTDRRLHDLGLAARLHVHFDDEIGAALEAPGQSLRQKRRHLPRRPAEEEAVGIRGRVRDQPFVAWRRDPPRRSGATPACGRPGCWRDGRPSGCRDETRGRVT